MFTCTIYSYLLEDYYVDPLNSYILTMHLYFDPKGPLSKAILPSTIAAIRGK